MKIMDTSDGDGECQIDAVVSPKEKKTKQARLPFQTLSSDSPTNKKKRKSLASPEVRSAKLPKVNTKENSFKKPKETEDISEEIIIDEKGENEATETNNMKDNVKPVAKNETPDSKNKKTTPGKGLTKTKKSESKVQATSLTKFFKKIDKSNKESKCETQTTTSTNKDKEIVNNSSEKEESQVSKKSEAKDDTSKNKNSSSVTEVTTKAEDDDTDSNKDSKMSENGDSRISLSSDDNEQKQTDTSYLNGTMDVDSDIHLLSDDSDEENDDSDKSESDSKRTEHEDTDSKDDTNKNSGLHILAAKNKLLDSSKSKRLTPKQLEKKLEMQKKREMREKQRFEREKKLHEERESRKKEKEEKRKEREEKRKEREEKEKALRDQKKKEKELKDLKKQAELEQKQKEKEAKEEDRRKREEAKEEEKRRKEEERLEAERKKQKIASNFVSFFVAKKLTDSKPVEDEKKVVESRFMPFEIKADMRVAPAIRRNMTKSEKSKLDELIKSNDVNKSQLYICELKNKKYNIRKSEKTWPLESNDDVVILDEDEDTSRVVQSGDTIRQKLRPKLFMFEENRRPPYWGTWRKNSEIVRPRRPLGKDTKHFDYEVDSDEEWEEEEPGESLHGSDDEREKEEEPNEENEYDVDNDFMVPHGYLSEEEIGADEEDEDEEDLNPEQQKTKLKILGEQFEAERNTKTKKLKPKVIGCIWLNKENVYPENLSAPTIQFLIARQAWTREIPISLTPPADADNPNHPDYGTPAHKASIASSVRKAKAIEDATPDLIRLLHGNTNSQKFLLKEFLEYISRKNEGAEKLIPKSKLHQKIRDVATWMACPEPGPMQDKYCWYVTEACRTQYLGDEKLPLPNEWTYCLTPKKRSVNVEAADKPADKEKEKEKEKEKKTVPLITQFTKTLTAEEKQKQLTEKAASATFVSKSIEKPLVSTSATKATPPTNRVPKRATLISVPRGEPLPKSPRMSLMDKFVSKDSPLADNSNKKNKKSNKDDLDDDDCMIINVTDDQDEVSTSSKADSAKDVDKSPNKESVSEDDKPQNVSTSSDVDVVVV